MKVTALRDVETYIYSSVIMPLKGLAVPDLHFPSPIRGENGEEWQFQVRQERLHRDYRRNYQRTQAQRLANWEVVLFANGKEYVVAHFNPRVKWVKMYERPFRVLKAMPIMGKLYEGFYQNTPFGKIITEMDAPRVRPFRGRRHRGYDEPMEADSDGNYDVTTSEEMPF